MIVSTAHISSEKNLAEACALLLETGAMSLTLSGPKQRRLSLNEVRGLLINHQLPLTQRLQDLPDPITATDEVWQEPTAGSLIELLSAFFDSTSDAIYIKDVQGRYLFANEAYATAVGYPLANIIGHTDLAICTPAVARQTMKLDAEIIAQNRKKTFEETIANRHGINTYLTTKMPLWSRGNLLGMFGTARELIAFTQSNAIQYRQEEQLEAIFQSLPDLFFRIAPDGTILDYRAQVEADLYKPASEFLGRRMQDVLPKAQGELFIVKLEEQKSTGKLVSYQYDLELDSGTTRFEARLRNIENSDQYILLIRNITDQYNEHLALAKARQQLRLALEATKESVWDLDLCSGAWTASAQSFSMLGYPPDTEVQSLAAWIDNIHPFDQALLEAAFEAIIHGESTELDVEFKALNNAGSYQWIRTRGKVVEFDAENCARRIVGTHEDVTRRRQLEEKLKLAATVFKNTSEGVIIADPRGYIIDVNQGFEQATGFNREEVIGKHTRFLNSGRQAPAFYRSMWEQLEKHGNWNGEIWSKGKDGSLLPEWLNISAVKDENNLVSHYVAVFSDISVLKRSEEKLDHLAHHDTLTGLPNRLMLQARLGRALVHAQRNKNIVALLFLDIDRFKNINDSMGHQAGDSLLKQVAARLKTCVRTEDTVARLGGDEFVVLLENLSDMSAPAHVAEKILAEIRNPFTLQNADFYTTTSIGISLYPNDGNGPAELLRNADTAMYQVKQRGRDSFAFYTQKFTDIARKKIEMESELHKAIDQNEMQLWYQPQFDLESEEMVGMEALIRWIHPNKGFIAPDHFIPLAEESGLIVKVGEWVIDQACSQIRDWLDRGFTVPRIAINISGSEMRQGKIIHKLKESLANNQLEGCCLEVEITENFMMQDLERAVQIINDLNGMGIEVAVDDFGTGYSSLAYLKSLPIRRLKIDKSFVTDIPNDPQDMAITQAIIAMGRSLGLDVIAEGVETRQQQKFLRENHCSLGQGYLFCRPSKAEKIETWLTKD